MIVGSNSLNAEVCRLADHKLTHLDEHGQARMVDVGDKPITRRIAVAEGFISIPGELIAQLQTLGKGNAIEVARLAGLMGAKRTADLIPLCHPVPLDKVDLEVVPLVSEGQVRVVATASCSARTGVEMEAMTAVSVALLTLYDMAKATARDMTISNIRLLEKSGGRSGQWRRSDHQK